MSFVCEFVKEGNVCISACNLCVRFKNQPKCWYST